MSGARFLHHPLLRRFLRFGIVGVVNMGVGYALYALLLLGTPLGPQGSLLISFWLGVLWNYLATARFVFGESGFSRLPAYVLCYLVVYALNARALDLLVVRAQWPPLLAQAVLIPAAAVLTFVMVSVALTYRRSPAK
jgi:putative flippase GtrA